MADSGNRSVELILGWDQLGRNGVLIYSHKRHESPHTMVSWSLVNSYQRPGSDNT